MFDLSLEKIAVIGFLAILLVGPERLPRYAAQLAKWVKVVRGMADDAKSRVAAEMGPEFEDVDWQRLDPRRYHPRRLLQDAWNGVGDEPEPSSRVAEEPEPAHIEAVAPGALPDAVVEPTEPGILELFAEHEAEQRHMREQAPAPVGDVAA